MLPYDGVRQVPDGFSSSGQNFINFLGLLTSLASLMAQRVKNPAAMQETRVWSLGWEDSLKEEMATHYSILAWRIPWTEELGRLQSTGSQSCTTVQLTFTFSRPLCGSVSSSGKWGWEWHSPQNLPQWLNEIIQGQALTQRPARSKRCTNVNQIISPVCSPWRDSINVTDG